MDYALHKFNKGFKWRSPVDNLTTLTQEQALAYDREGFFVFKNAFSPEEIADVTSAIDPLEDKMTQFLRTQKDGRLYISQADAITFTIHLVKQSPLLKRFAAHPSLAGIVHDLLGDNARLYWDQSVYKKPENPKPFPYHQDNGYTFIEPQIYLTCWIPLVDVDEENGCPWVVPRLHREGTLHHETTDLGFECLKSPASEVCVSAKAGDIVVFSSLTPHKTGPNLTDTTRKAYILQYAPDGCRIRSGEGELGALQSDAERQFFVVKDGRPVT